MKFLLFASLAAGAADWPTWRGPANNGVSTEKAPIAWTKEHAKWRVPLPESNNSTPIVYGDKIFLAQARKKTGERLLLCLDRNTGKQLWQAGFTYNEPEPTHETNPYASASPVTDGKLVIVWLGSSGLAAFDFNGKQIWHRDLGKQRHTWGYGSSPTLAGNRVYLNFGPGDRSFVAAFDKATGKTLWQNEVKPGKGQKIGNWSLDDTWGSWSSPLMIRSDGKEQIVVTLPETVIAYEPATGEKLWSAPGLGTLIYPSPVFDGETLFVASGYSGPNFAIRPGAQSPKWRREQGRQMIGTGVVHNGRLYTISNNGVADCADMATGEMKWSGRLPASTVWSSPVLSDGKIYVMNQTGEVFVLATGDEFKILASTKLDEAANASVVIAGGDLYLRTHEALWRISQPQKK